MSGELTGLLERVRAATGPDREIDRAIHVVSGIEFERRSRFGDLNPAYTSSLDVRARKTLQLALNGEYFDQIKSGVKTEEYRLTTSYWTRRLNGKRFDRIVLTRGYPPKDDLTRHLTLPWIGCTTRTITHPHFGNNPVDVFVIDVSGTDFLP